MFRPQPQVSPLPESLSFDGKAAVVTGATSGLGLEFSRQLLERGITTLTLAVRNVTKGEAVREQLLAEPRIRANNPNAVVDVIKLDAASYQSVKEFTNAFKSRHDRLDILMLNAGMGFVPVELTIDGHETTLQVNYLSNVLLLFEFLPILEATSSITGHPSRITVTGSRMQAESILRQTQLTEGQPVLEYLDDPNSYHLTKRYGDSKFLVCLFLQELKDHYGPEKVIINQFCPGMVQTDLSESLPIHMRIFARLLKRARARPLHVGGWTGLHAAGVVGAESHCGFLHDKDLHKVSPDDFLLSAAGQKLQKQLWNESLEEIRALTTVPSWALSTKV